MVLKLIEGAFSGYMYISIKLIWVWSLGIYSNAHFANRKSSFKMSNMFKTITLIITKVFFEQYLYLNIIFIYGIRKKDAKIWHLAMRN